MSKWENIVNKLVNYDSRTCLLKHKTNKTSLNFEYLSKLEINDKKSHKNMTEKLNPFNAKAQLQTSIQIQKFGQLNMIKI